ncbi:hypothetical protein JOC34_002933 [Virgibacillus halotolerans]|nr:hypothetical protein [Virgibacillus halotolerans]
MIVIEKTGRQADNLRRIMGDDDVEKVTEIIALDCEWVILMKEAKVQGITIEEVRLFLAGTEEAAK